MNVHAYTHMHMPAHTCTYLYTYSYTCICTHSHMHMPAHMCTCLYTYSYTCICTHSYTQIQIFGHDQDESPENSPSKAKEEGGGGHFGADLAYHETNGTGVAYIRTYMHACIHTHMHITLQMTSAP